MKTKYVVGFFMVALATFVVTGCKSNESCCLAPKEKSAPTAAAVSTSPAVAATPASPAPTPAPRAFKGVRIKAGSGDAFNDADGNPWIAETGFVEGDVVERPDAQITNTKTPKIYQSEHYSMTSFSYPVPNGKYLVKLHFCETFDGITGPGERVFSFNVEGKQFNDFDVWAKAGGPLKAYIETVPVEVKDGKLDITFTPKVENPQINGIEILPAP